MDGMNHFRWLIVAKICSLQFYNRTTKEEAIFVHAGIWSWNADLETGNFVPLGEKPPSTVTESRV